MDPREFWRADDWDRLLLIAAHNAHKKAEADAQEESNRKVRRPRRGR